MKKILFILAFTLSSLYVRAQEQHNVYMDSLGFEHITVAKTPQVAISGYFTNLVNKPTTLGGYGITDGAATSGLVYNILSKTANYTILSTDFNTAFLKILDLYVDATSGNITITMPSVISGYMIYVTKTDASANTVTVSGATGNSTLTYQTQSRQYLNNLTSWYNH